MRQINELVVGNSQKHVATYSRERHCLSPICKASLSQRKFKMCSTVYKSNEIVQENVPMVLKHRGQKKGFLTFLCLLLSQSRQILGKHSESFPQLRQETLPIMSIRITHIGYISQPSIHNTTIYKKIK